MLGLVLAYIVVTGGGLSDLAGPPVEQVKVQRITLPGPGVIQLEVVNDGPQAVTIAQVAVDGAYWTFTAEPPGAIERFGRATFTIPYPWVDAETHVVQLITSLGATIDAEIAAAVQSPRMTLDLFMRFALVGLYVGIVPVALGMLWYPLMRRLSRRAMNFILALTIGLLIYLAVGTWLDATEFAAELPVFWQGVPLVLFVAAFTLGVILAVTARRRGSAGYPLGTSYRIALGIGLHNLGEGLAIGAAFVSGQAALGVTLVLGFTLHNITEGVGIAAPLVRRNPGLKHFLLLGALAGSPAILGTWLGSFAFDPVLAVIFLGIGLGAILQVVWEVGKLVARDSATVGDPLVNWTTLGGVVAGVAVMYFTAFLVKF
ncbi:MAG: metal transporter [Chloroflexi bacterium]|nr:metal transporter [Chloroflexota bacterium]